MNKKVLAAIFFGCMLLISCSGKESKENDDNNFSQDANNEEQENNEANHKEPDEPQDPDSLGTYPFTGMQTKEPVDQRPISVMVNNQIQARPQSGLSKADLVFEFLTEGSITRFLAIFQSEQPEIVGPVRSARQYFFELAQGYDAIYVYHGAADSVNNLLQQQGIDHINGSIYDNDGLLFKRESFREPPHNSYLLFSSVNETAMEKNYDIIREVEPLPFSGETATINGEQAHRIEISYPGRNPADVVEFIYDPVQETYTRHEAGEPTVELETEDPIQVQNVFVIETGHEADPQSSTRRKIDIQSGGKAYLFQKGIVQEVTWANDQGRLLPYKDGNPLGFTPGKTWTNIVPTSPGIETAVTILEE